MKDIDENIESKGELVTVAIHTYEKAQILKSILESEGIEAEISNVNIIQPNPAGNVRVRINSKNLTQALKIIEDVDLSYKETTDEYKKGKKEVLVNNELLVPIDFSDYSMRACEFAFRLAKDMRCEVKILHSFFSPYYPAAMPFGDAYTFQTPDKELFKDVYDKTDAQMILWVDRLKEKISSGEIPDIYFTYVLKEGLAEEEIMSYAKKNHPMAIVMGTRGNNEKEINLIGSVTAEVIDGCRTPVFAIPDRAPDIDLSEMTRLGFLSNFREREFSAFDQLMTFIGKYPIKVYIIHMNKKEDVWDEIKLAGITDFVKNKYPSLEIDYKLVDATEERPEVIIDDFVRENGINMLAMSSSRRNIFARLFNSGLARRVIFHSETPLLVLRGEV